MWRRGRHIRVKAEARPASRFIRLSMLSNIATATTRQFSEKIPLRKYLESNSSFAIARDELLVTYDEETIDNEQFLLLLKKNVSRNPSFLYKQYEEFDFQTMNRVQWKLNFESRKILFVLLLSHSWSPTPHIKLDPWKLKHRRYKCNRSYRVDFFELGAFCEFAD